VPLLKRQTSLTEAVLISFGPAISRPKTLQRWRANTSQQQIICCTVSVSILQNLQVGSRSNRPIIFRCLHTGACPVRIATTIFSWGLLNLSMSSGLFLNGLPIKSLPCLWPGKSLQDGVYWFHLAHDNHEWWVLVKTIMKFQVPQNVGIYWLGRSCYCLRRTLLQGAGLLVVCGT
jgi:hypothetical protein